MNAVSENEVGSEEMQVGTGIASEPQSTFHPEPSRPFVLLPGLSTKKHVTIIDDDEAIILYLGDFLEAQGFSVSHYNSAEEFLKHLNHPTTDTDLIFCDLRLPGLNGIELAKTVKKQRPDIPIVMITAYGNVESAVEAIKQGAYDYIEKPFDLSRLSLIVDNAIRWRSLNVENISLKRHIHADIKIEGVFCISQAMHAVYDLVKRVSQTESNVMITGESGVGKEVIARAIHDNSNRADKPFVSINCSAIPESLLESELFGHTKGSFTGAMAHRKGLFEEADGGTLFLDEIGDLEISLQAKLLRVLQEHKIRAVGDNKFRDVNVRIITATHKNLSNEIKANRFREDLYYRMNVIQIHIPPLRQRREDILVLATHFLTLFSKTHASPAKGFTEAAKAKLLSLPWKGNVRELQNVVERGVVLATSEYLDEDDIPVAQDQQLDDLIGEIARDTPTLRDVENRYILTVLKGHAGKTEPAAAVLGLSRRTLYRKLSELRKPKTVGAAPEDSSPDELEHDGA